MAVRGEEVAGSIDAQVRDSVEKMVAEIRSSIEDVRVAVDQQLKAALQSVQADVNSVSFLPQIRKSIDELESALQEERPAAAPAGGGSASRIKAAVQTIERGKSQVDLLNGLLEQCLGFGSRVALLILRGETFSGWKGLGFSAHGGNDETIKRFNAAPGLVPELDLLLREERVVTWDGSSLSTRLGVSGSERAVLVPMVIKDKVAAAVFIDAVSDDVSKLDSDALQLLVFTTGLLVDTLAIRKKIPSPSLADAAEAAPQAAPRPAVPTPAPVPVPPAATSAPRAEQPVPRGTDSGTVAINPAQIRELMSQQRPDFNIPADDDFGGAAAPAPAATAPPAPPRPATPPPAPPPPRPAPEPAAPAAPAASEDRPSTQYIPPPGLARGGSALGGAKPEDAKKHDEARRFARLLVSEIKLYNESKVEQGRKNRDLYERLKEDIDRSRQMYDERIAEDVRKSSNYFYDELVRILADGNADTLGL